MKLPVHVQARRSSCFIRKSADQVKQKVEARFMRAWEEREIERQKAFSEGQNEL